MVVEPKPRPPYERECVWCLQEIPDGEEDNDCPSNSGDKHVLWLFDTTGLKAEAKDGN